MSPEDFYQSQMASELTLQTREPFGSLIKRLNKNCIMRVDPMWHWVAGYMCSITPVDDSLTECRFKVFPAPFKYN
jgi:hypothetical protein